ncbi:DUF4198 domain-containing protein [Pseudogemmobacter sp. W21_MBD1_M6]|uniref:DUF4198 domain-containing protein n=1 Tax=Pseudogemmobacter sp. W21_MBD1_M6 TaxID=3240271 RepID=UPI003F9D8D2D
MFNLRSLTICLALGLTASPTLSHEFWLDPTDFQVETGQKIVADIKVGQDFKGGTYSYMPRAFVRFDIAAGDAMAPVEGRMGNIPAVDTAPLADGLNILVHQTTDTVLTYTEWEKFTGFVKHKDFKGVLERHAERGLAEEKFKEVYSRYAKSLVAVGDGKGTDRTFGMETEIVALANPYTDDLSAGLPVKVLYQGMPRADAQVEIFDRNANAEVVTTTTRTDSQGIAMIPVLAGHTYMVDAVVLREPDAAKAEQTQALWESLWANLTFAVPG